MLKLSDINELLFNSIDTFFRGMIKPDMLENDTNLHDNNVLNYNYIEWNLHQRYVDIAILDLKATFGWMIPGPVRKIARQIRQLGLIYLYTDIAEEENDIIPGYQHIFPEPTKNKILYNPQVIQDVITSKCLSISDWIKGVYRKCNLIIDFGLLKKPQYFSGSFDPYKFQIAVVLHGNILKKSNGVKFNSLIAYHKRI